MQENHETPVEGAQAATRVNVNVTSSIYEVGVQELRKVSDDDASKRIDKEFSEARGREGARLHVMLKAVSENDRRGLVQHQESIEAMASLMAELRAKSAHLTHLIETFENGVEKRFGGVHDDVRGRAEALTKQVSDFSHAETAHHEAITDVLARFRENVAQQASTHHGALSAQAVSNHEVMTTQSRAQFEALSTQGSQETERIAVDVRDTRDELVSLVDSRMNQSDASFAALRGDIEVVKFLVMDLIKDRIGRHDPKQKPF